MHRFLYVLLSFGHVYRNELKDCFTGLSRVRSLTQDDGHIFCTQSEEQIKSEVGKFLQQTLSIYSELGFTLNDVEIKLALRPKDRLGDDKTWDKAEQALQQALEMHKIDYEVAAGEGAFYGPKIELHLYDALGRKWQCGTIQLDYVLPKELDAFYYNSKK